MNTFKTFQQFLIEKEDSSLPGSPRYEALRKKDAEQGLNSAGLWRGGRPPYQPKTKEELKKEFDKKYGKK